MKEILKYFPDLTELQIERFQQLDELYRYWNARINVISRKDIDNLYINHILHSLALAKVFRFQSDAKVMDLGCGGGFPGIPLAIMFPNTQFILVDSIAKKINVCGEVADSLELDNVQVRVGRAEEQKEKVDFVVTRAVATMDKLELWTRKIISTKDKHAMPNGLFAYKGMDRVEEELKVLPQNSYSEVFPMKEFFEEEFFETKCIVYYQKGD